MPMSSGGRVASSSGCATRPKAQEIGSTGSAAPTQRSLSIGRYVMAMAEHREPCDSRRSCTVLGAPGGEIPPGDSTISTVYRRAELFCCGSTNGRAELQKLEDVLQHVAARGRRLDPAAHPVPLHPGPKHQARS